jgi:hypothetical protein
MNTRSTYSVPKEIRELYEALTHLTNMICTMYLNDEYAQMCRKLTAALCRKRPSPLAHGRVDIWVTAIVHTIASANFAYDATQTPHTTLDDLCEALETSKTTVGNKATAIRKLLKISVFDPTWTLPSRMDSNPMVWMLTVNGFVVDIRTMPLEAQMVAYEKGLIPYIPALQPNPDADRDH